MAQRAPGEGPFHVDDLRDGDRYELSRGHPIYCAPTRGDGAGRVGISYEVLATDPAVDEAGVDPGYRGGSKDLRAPDVGVGNVPDRPGFIAGAPALAVEVAGTGQNEAELAAKIEELFAAGTRWVWVMRVLHPRHVEVHEPGAPMRTAQLDEVLTAPGLLKNAVPVRALFDRDAGHEVALRNLLQRKGYESLQALRSEERAAGEAEGRKVGEAEGRKAGEVDGLRKALIAFLTARGLAPEPDELAQIDGERELAVLHRWIAAGAVASSVADVLR